MAETPTRTDGVVSWIGWHLGELAGVIVPGVVALTVTPWAAVVSVLAGVSWAVHEVRSARRQRALSTSRVQHTLSASRSEETIGWGEAR